MPGGGGKLDLIAAAGRAGLPFVLTSTETAGAIAALACEGPTLIEAKIDRSNYGATLRAVRG